MALSRWIGLGLVCLAAIATHASATRDCNWKPECPSEGEHLFPIPCEGNCNKYYECKDGNLKKQTCGIGLNWKKFDPVERKCAFSAVDCAWYLEGADMCGFKPKCPASGEVKIPIPCEGYCKNYIQCKDGQWTLATCTNILWPMFSNTTADCDRKVKVDCNWWKSLPHDDELGVNETTGGPGNPEPDNEQAPVETDAPEPDTEQPPVETDAPEPDTEQPPVETDAPEPDTEQPPVETDAPEPDTEQPPVETDAPEPDTEQPPVETDAPEPDTEQPPVETDAPITEPAPTDPTTPAAPGTTIAVGCDHTPDCPATGSALLSNPCPNKCQTYFQCTDGAWTVQRCLPWQNFDAVLNKCVFILFAKCEADPNVPTPAPTQPPCASTPPKCPSKGTVLFPDDCKCQKYYECKDGKAESKKCLPWENFDVVLGKCRWALQVECDRSKITTTPAPPPTAVPGCGWEPQCPAAGSARLGILCEDSCNKYIQCLDGVPTTETCTWPKKFDVETLECTWYYYTCAQP